MACGICSLLERHLSEFRTGQEIHIRPAVSQEREELAPPLPFHSGELQAHPVLKIVSDNFVPTGKGPSA